MNERHAATGGGMTDSDPAIARYVLSDTEESAASSVVMAVRVMGSGLRRACVVLHGPSSIPACGRGWTCAACSHRGGHADMA